MSQPGKIYNVDLIRSIPIPGAAAGVLPQTLPSIEDVQLRRTHDGLTAAGYEVLLLHFQRQQNFLIELRDEFRQQGNDQMADRIAMQIVEVGTR